MFKVNQSYQCGTLGTVFKVGYRNSILQIIHENHVFLQEGAAIEIFQLVDGFGYSRVRKLVIYRLQGRQEGIFIERVTIISDNIWPVLMRVAQRVCEKLDNPILIIFFSVTHGYSPVGVEAETLPLKFYAQGAGFSRIKEELGRQMII